MNSGRALLPIFLLVSSSVYAQELKGFVLDAESKKPIPYVNIGVVNKNIGTVSMEDGSFILELTSKNEKDSIRVSSIGYASKSFLVRDLVNSNNHNVVLSPSITILREVVISDKPRPVTSLGHTPKTKFTKAGFFFNRLGHEIGTLFENANGELQLDSVQLNFVTCIYDSVFVRLNVYSVDGEEIKNILPNNVLLKWSKKKVLSRPIVDLSEYHLSVGKKFVISIEIIKDLAASGLKFFAVLKAQTDKTYFRSTSQGDWQIALHKGQPIGISMLAFAH